MRRQRAVGIAMISSSVRVVRNFRGHWLNLTHKKNEIQNPMQITSCTVRMYMVNKNLRFLNDLWIQFIPEDYSAVLVWYTCSVHAHACTCTCTYQQIHLCIFLTWWIHLWSVHIHVSCSCCRVKDFIPRLLAGREHVDRAKAPPTATPTAASRVSLLHVHVHCTLYMYVRVYVHVCMCTYTVHVLKCACCINVWIHLHVHVHVQCTCTYRLYI